MPLFGPPNVERLMAKNNVRGLIKALGYQKDSQVRVAAARSLGALGDPRAVEPLLAALGDWDRYLRQAAAAALGRIHDPRAVEPLIEALADTSRPVSRSAALALAKFDDACVEEALLASLRRARSPAAAIEALGQIGSTRAVDRIIRALGHRDSGVRKAAAKALGEIGDPRAVEPLCARLSKDPADPFAREIIVRALGQIDDPRTVEPLIAALQDAQRKVRQAAAQGLSTLYRSGKLDQAQKALILYQRETLEAEHRDGPFAHKDEHQDRPRHHDVTCLEGHFDHPVQNAHNDGLGGHVDQGIGVEFPF